MIIPIPHVPYHDRLRSMKAVRIIEEGILVSFISVDLLGVRISAITLVFSIAQKATI